MGAILLTELTLAQLLSAPHLYDGKDVCIKADISHFVQRKNFYKIRLSWEGKVLWLIVPKKFSLKKGKAKIYGKFVHKKAFLSRTFYNRIYVRRIIYFGK